MKYFLDFDRTLFDTDAYNWSLLKKEASAPFREDLEKILLQPRDAKLPDGLTREDVWAKVSDALMASSLSFEEGELDRFLYPDVRPVLERLAGSVTVITFGEITRQQAKVENVLRGLGVTVLYTGDQHKADYLAASGYTVTEDTVFVDDYDYELSEMEKRFPEMKLYQIQRTEEGATGTWPVIRSLDELP